MTHKTHNIVAEITVHDENVDIYDVVSSILDIAGVDCVSYKVEVHEVEIEVD